jgi:hypothetical protein
MSDDLSDSSPETALARQNVGLFAQPEIREAIRGAKGLSDDALDRVSEGLARLGVALILPNRADLHAKLRPHQQPSRLCFRRAS